MIKKTSVLLAVVFSLTSFITPSFAALPDPDGAMKDADAYSKKSLSDAKTAHQQGDCEQINTILDALSTKMTAEENLNKNLDNLITQELIEGVSTTDTDNRKIAHTIALGSFSITHDTIRDSDNTSYASCISAKAPTVTQQTKVIPTTQPAAKLQPAAQSTLSDIASSKNAVAIKYLHDHSVISGYPDGTFKPDNTVTRAELLKILVGGKGVTPTVDQYNNCFTDVKAEWFAPYACYAKSEGWVQGYADGSFQPNKTVSKIEATKMLVNSQGYTVPTQVTDQSYADVDMAQWYAPFIKVAKDKGLLEETGSSFGISDLMTRGGISENIYRAMTVDPTTQVPVTSSTTVQTAPQQNSSSENVIQVSTLSIYAMWKNWDADAQDDGFELTTYFKDASGNLVFPKVNNWSVNVKVYKAEVDYDKYGDFSTHKIPGAIYSLDFAKNEVKYDTINSPYVQVAEEKVPQLVKGFGYVWIEAEFTSPTQGTFSASDNYVSFYKGN